MSDISNVLITVCGFCTICCGAFGVALFLMFRVTGRSLLFPAITALSEVFFNRHSGENEEAKQGLRTRGEARRTDPTSSIQARVQAANQDFNQAIGGSADASGFRQAGPRTGVSPEQSRADKIRNRGQNIPDVGEARIPDIRSSRRRRKDDYEEGDELFDIDMDGDGDGFLGL